MRVMRLRSGLALAPLLLVSLACAPQDDTTSTGDTSSAASAGGSTSGSAGASSTASAGACMSADQLPTLHPGRLTIGTDSPAYEPWFEDNDPTNGQGYESAVAYAVAAGLGYSPDDVTWVKVPFNTSYAPGEKDFDFDINQISITPAREKVVDFSTGYYAAAQAVVTLKDTQIAGDTSLEELATYKLGAQTGTTSLTAVRDDIRPDTDAAVFETTNDAKQALLNGQIDGIVADLPTAFYISSAEIKGSTIVGQFQASGDPEEFGMLFGKGNPLKTCVDSVLTGLENDGTLDQLQTRWLSTEVDVPELQ